MDVCFLKLFAWVSLHVCWEGGLMIWDALSCDNFQLESANLEEKHIFRESQGGKKKRVLARTYS